MSIDTSATTVTVLVHDRRDIGGARAIGWVEFVARHTPLPLSYHPLWPMVLARGLGHTPFVLEAEEAGTTRGLLSLALVSGPFFGRFLVGMPYLNYGGPVADDDAIARLLIDQAVGLADRLGVRRLELRYDRAVEHPSLTRHPSCKVNVRRPLPAAADELWKGLGSGVRNQVRKGRKSGLTVSWGGEELFPDFYSVFSRNMRDLGTPVYGRSLFRSIVRQFPDRAEFCVVRSGAVPVAAALLFHGWGVTEVPSAGSLRQYNRTCGNMLMYWHLMERAVERGQGTFDFGRCTPGNSVFKFKEQWGGLAGPAEWQAYLRVGDATEARPENARYRRLIGLWRHLPVPLTRWIGPPITRGIP